MIRNWKTTLAGFIGMVAHLSVNGMTVKQFLVGLTIAAIGMLAKDHDALPR